MSNKIELLPIQLENLRYYFEYFLDLKLEEYLKTKDSKATMKDSPVAFKLLYMGALNETNYAHHLLGFPPQVKKDNYKDELDIINKEIDTYIYLEKLIKNYGEDSGIVNCAKEIRCCS